MRCLLVVLLLVLSARAWSCSCLGIAWIDETIAHYPILVEAQVVSLEEVHSPEYGRQVHSVTLRVNKTLKGALSSETITVEHWMCYASLYPELMKLRHTYVLPLGAAQENGRYAMAGSAHSGLELIDGNLYTFEQTDGAGRELKFYNGYSDFQQRFQQGGSSLEGSPRASGGVISPEMAAARFNLYRYLSLIAPALIIR